MAVSTICFREGVQKSIVRNNDRLNLVVCELSQRAGDFIGSFGMSYAHLDASRLGGILHLLLETPHGPTSRVAQIANPGRIWQDIEYEFGKRWRGFPVCRR
jgi:hypothetical protein